MILYELTAQGDVIQIDALPKNVYLSCAFGCFDGVHIGHVALLDAAKSSAEALEKKYRAAVSRADSDLIRVCPAVWTFASPVSIPWILSVRERLAECGRNGVKYAVCREFDDVRSMSPRDFVFSLVKDARLIHGVCGYNFRFGKDRSGDAYALEVHLRSALSELSPASTLPLITEKARAVTVLDEVSALGAAVSSTRIRALIAEGDMESVSVLLGRPYSLTGTVIPGNQLGRKLSKPTANLRYSPHQLVPKRGVYFTLCSLDGTDYPSVTNIGYRPTVNTDTSDITCETHLLDFSGSVYGKTVEIRFCHYARGEISFPDLPSLANQIALDASQANLYFTSPPKT
ncbi:MAG: riboflavin biosynthesis protein RibF [Clostridia bacterium]|nr:riboflavin biosynthesis protein RibF [Clostridia bacterium]